MVCELPETIPFEERLKQVCDQYKDGYVEPPKPVKEKKPWEIERDIYMKALHNGELVLPNGEVNPRFEKYLL